MQTALEPWKKKPGDLHQIITCGSCQEATIVRIEKLENENGTKYNVTYNIPDYGETQPYEYKEGFTYAKERRDGSMMPNEYLYKRGRDFDWSYYKEDTTIQKGIVNGFVSEYEKFRRTGRGLYICSKTKGSGKTLLACCLANEIIEKYSAVVKFCSVIDYIEFVKDKNDEAKEMVNSFKKCGLLVVDDIGVQTEKQDWIINSIFSLVDYRYRENLPTIYTSNLPIEKASSDDRIQSRIYKMSIPVCIPEFSVRMLLADENNKQFLKEILKN